MKRMKAGGPEEGFPPCGLRLRGIMSWTFCVALVGKFLRFWTA